MLFDQILMGQLEFPLPYWDNVSERAKVNACILTDSKPLFIMNVIAINTDRCLFTAAGSDSIHAGG